MRNYNNTFIIPTHKDFMINKDGLIRNIKTGLFPQLVKNKLGEVCVEIYRDKNDIFDGTIFDKFNKGGMINEYTYIRIKDSNGGIKQVARFLESIPEQFNALLNLTDKANDLGFKVEKITAQEYENFSILEDEKGIKELTDLLNPKNKDNF